jgi:hypothetical protein
MKVLISSSNYTRYQVNPNLPIMDGEFFRRRPGDGQKYTFNGVEMAPRVAINRIAFSPELPTRLKLPVYDQALASINEPGASPATVNIMQVFPNPASDNTQIFLNYSGNFEMKLIDISGKVLRQISFQGDQHIFDVSNLAEGLYIISVNDLQNGKSFTQKLVKK